ncbi:MAG TPA: hypothetical protein VGG27_18830 [Magnetospirillaceae bacterium]|jgi:hypothetical protein
MSTRMCMILGAVFLGVTTIEALAPRAAFAEGKVGSDSDILGLRLSMSPDEIRQYFTDKLGVAKVFEMKGGIATDTYKAPVETFALIAQTVSSEAHDANQKAADAVNASSAAHKEMGDNSPIVSKIGDFGFNKIKVAFFPKEAGVTAILRQQVYTEKERPTMQTTIASLKEKYGMPETSTPKQLPGFPVQFIWTSHAGLSKKGHLWDFCLNTTNAYFGGIDTMDNYANFDDRGNASGIVQNFVNTADHDTKLFHLTECGVVLIITLRPNNAGEYLVQLDETLIDISKGQMAINAYAADFWANAKKAKNGQMSKDVQRKPNL